MSAPSTTRGRSGGAPPSPTEPTHFRCSCGRSVATPAGSDADRTRRCTRCRRRIAAEHALERGS